MHAGLAEQQEADVRMAIDNKNGLFRRQREAIPPAAPVSTGESTVKTLNITWLGECPKCENETHKVETEKGCGFRLYDGDKVTCSQCGHAGIVECDDDIAYASWDEVEEKAQ